MPFSLAYLKSDSQFLYRNFAQEAETHILNISELKEKDIDALFFNEEAINGDLIHFLEGENRFYPIRKGSDFSIDSVRFEQLSLEEARKIFKSTQDAWLMGNNIILIEELFKNLEVLQNLWPNDRTAFFEQLWFIIKSTVGAKNFKMIYNDIIVSKNENEKNKLIQIAIEGRKLPNPISGGELESKIMAHYEKSFSSPFLISDYDKNTGKTVFLGRTKGSPVVMMMELHSLSKLQVSILSALFQGLQK